MISMLWLHHLGKVIDMYKYPCKDCPDRVVGCHSTCQKYQEARAEHTRNTMEILKVKKEQEGMDSYKCRVIIETKKRFEKRR